MRSGRLRASLARFWRRRLGEAGSVCPLCWVIAAFTLRSVINVEHWRWPKFENATEEKGMRKSMTAAALAASLALSTVAASTSAEARWRGGPTPYYGGYYGAYPAYYGGYYPA